MGLLRRKKPTTESVESGARVLRAEASGGDVWEEPSEDLLFLLFEDLAAQGDWFVVDEIGTDSSYMQVAWADGKYQVERRAGAEDTHQHAYTDDIRLAHEAVCLWAFGGSSDGQGRDLVWQAGMPG